MPGITLNASASTAALSIPDSVSEPKTTLIFPGDSQIVTGRFKDDVLIYKKEDRPVEIRKATANEIAQGKYPTYIRQDGLKKLESNVDLTAESIIIRKPDPISANGSVDEKGIITIGALTFYNEWVVKNINKADALYDFNPNSLSTSPLRCISKEKHVEVIEIDKMVLESLGAKVGDKTVEISVPSWGPDGKQKIVEGGLLVRIWLGNTDKGEPVYEYYGLSLLDREDYIPEFIVPPDFSIDR